MLLYRHGDLKERRTKQAQSNVRQGRQSPYVSFSTVPHELSMDGTSDQHAESYGRGYSHLFTW